MKKKTLALLLCLTMVFGLLAGCGSTQEAPVSSAPESVAEAPAPEPEAAPAEPDTLEAEGSLAEEVSAVPEEPQGYVYEGEWATYPIDGDKTLTMWCEFPGFLAMVGIDSYVGSSVWEEAERVTGVHIEFTEVSMMTATELFSLMCAANDMKDIIGGASTYYGSTAAAVEEEILIDLSEYAEQYMGNYLTILNDPQYAEARDKAYNSEGQLVEISSISDDYKPTSGAQIRQDWLDEQGFDTPKTYEDWEKVLTSFKNNYGCGSALMLSGATQMTNLVAGYNTAGSAESSMGGSTINMYQIDGVIRNGYLDESYKEYITMMNRWYEAGLISKDFITASSDGAQNNMDGNILSGDSGIWFSQGNFIGQYEMQAQVTNPDFAIAGIPDPTHPEYTPDGITHFTAEGGQAGGSGALSVSTNCEDVETACKWLDYFWTPEGQLLCNYGIEGEGLEFDENGEPQFTAFIAESSNFQFYMVGYTLSGVPTLADFDKSFFTYGENVLEAFDIWDECSDDANALPSALSLSTDQAEEYSLLFGDINTMAVERIGKFVTGSMDIETEWDTFQQDLIDMGIEDCIAIYQEAYDSYMENKA